MKSVFIYSILLFVSISMFAQNEQNLGLAFGNGTALTVARAEYTYYLGLGKKQKFKIGFGARVISGFGQDLRFATVNTDNNGDGGADQNSLQVDNVRLGGLNTVLGIKYSFNEHWDLGLRFDVVGLGFGATQGGTFTDVSSGESRELTSKAPNPNIAFTRGQVMSDNLWVGYTFSERHQLYAAFSFLGAEYEVDNSGLNLPDPRFERIHQMLVIGYNFRMY